MSQLPLCEHVKIGGARCGSPALRDQKYCHHHAGVHRLVPRTHVYLPASPAMEIDPSYPYQLPYLEDFEALQIGYMQFIRGVVDKWIDERRAKLVLEALKAAGTNLRHKDKLMARAAELVVRKKPPAGVKPTGAAKSSPGSTGNAR
jgi:hypothetical protein